MAAGEERTASSSLRGRPSPTVATGKPQLQHLHLRKAVTPTAEPSDASVTRDTWATRRQVWVISPPEISAPRSPEAGSRVVVRGPTIQTMTLDEEGGALSMSAGPTLQSRPSW